MITEINMYWLTRLDGIHNMFAIGVTVGAVALAFLVPFSVAAKMDGNSIAKTLFKWTSITTILLGVSTLGVIFVPTTKEMAAIYAIPAISRSDVVQKDIPEIYDAGMRYIKTKLETAEKQ